MPILLGGFLLALNVADAPRLYGMVVVVVVYSVVVQGSLVLTVAHGLRLPMRTVEPQPWTLGVRLREEPHGAHRFTIAAGAPAEGRTVAELADLPADAWVSLNPRGQQLPPTTGSTELRAVDDVFVLADRDRVWKPASTRIGHRCARNTSPADHRVGLWCEPMARRPSAQTVVVRSGHG